MPRFPEKGNATLYFQRCIPFRGEMDTAIQTRTRTQDLDIVLKGQDSEQLIFVSDRGIIERFDYP